MRLKWIIFFQKVFFIGKWISCVLKKMFPALRKKLYKGNPIEKSFLWKKFMFFIRKIIWKWKAMGFLCRISWKILLKWILMGFCKKKKIVLEMKIPWFGRKFFSWKTNFEDSWVRTLILKTTWKFDLKSSGKKAF